MGLWRHCESPRSGGTVFRHLLTRREGDQSDPTLTPHCRFGRRICTPASNLRCSGEEEMGTEGGGGARVGYPQIFILAWAF